MDHQSHYKMPKRIALLSKHGKAAQIAPILSPLGIEIVATDVFDTDMLGTFSGEVERTLSPLECAKKKARLACELTGLEAGLGSEGSFGGGPLPGIMDWDTELIVLHDARQNIDIVANVSGPVSLQSFQGDDVSALSAALSGAEEGQAWIVKVDGHTIKGVANLDMLLATLEAMNLAPENGRFACPIDVAPDLRAMHSPLRQQYIIKAAQQLVERLQTHCPQCHQADFWLRDRIVGLPCRECGTPTDLAKAFIRQCIHCQYQQIETKEESVADPYRCHWCNP